MAESFAVRDAAEVDEAAEEEELAGKTERAADMAHILPAKRLCGERAARETCGMWFMRLFVRPVAGAHHRHAGGGKARFYGFRFVHGEGFRIHVAQRRKMARQTAGKSSYQPAHVFRAFQSRRPGTLINVRFALKRSTLEGVLA